MGSRWFVIFVFLRPLLPTAGLVSAFFSLPANGSKRGSKAYIWLMFRESDSGFIYASLIWTTEADTNKFMKQIQPQKHSEHPTINYIR